MQNILFVRNLPISAIGNILFYFHLGWSWICTHWTTTPHSIGKTLKRERVCRSRKRLNKWDNLINNFIESWVVTMYDLQPYYFWCVVMSLLVHRIINIDGYFVSIFYFYFNFSTFSRLLRKKYWSRPPLPRSLSRMNSSVTSRPWVKLR